MIVHDRVRVGCSGSVVMAGHQWWLVLVISGCGHGLWRSLWVVAIVGGCGGHCGPWWLLVLVVSGHGL